MTHSTSRRLLLGLTVVSVLCLPRPESALAASSFTLFETGQVRPLALSSDGGHLFAVNTPDNRLEIFSVSGGGLSFVASVGVGLEPLAVVARDSTCAGGPNVGASCSVSSDCPASTCTTLEVWVVNHLSDSISIVDVSDATQPRVTRTLLVGDEPRDIVFGGPNKDRAFITTAHRGQNTPLQSTIHTVLRTEGIGRADVWVFDANALGGTLGGTPVTVLSLFGDTPRALAVTPDGNTVYAAVFHSGNRTTALSEGAVCDFGQGAGPCGMVCAGGPNSHASCNQSSQCPSSTCVTRSPGGLPAPNTDHNSAVQPQVGLIVKFDGANWTDELGRSWNNAINFSLPDEDVFVIDASLPTPAQSGVFTGVGTILFNMAVNPANGKVYVANTDALNDVRFEGPGVFAAMFKTPGEPASVRGHLAESRITVLDGANVLPRHLNKHIDYTTCCGSNPTENARSVAFPLGMAVSSDGQTLYVAGFGSSEIAMYTTGQLEGDTFVPATSDQFPLTGLGACPGGSCGPTGVVLDENNGRLYVLTRFDNGISEVSTGSGSETAHHSLHNPEPANVVNGRRFNYDASFTSSHGDSACASCHIFADFDSLAWDLGDPDGDILANPGPFRVGGTAAFDNPPFVYKNFHPLKGPMTTQSLRGMANHGPMHWRGDRTGGNDTSSSQPDGGTFDEDAAFKKFNGAFPGLLGRTAELTAPEMQAYTDFILQVTYPPNPIRALDNSLTPEEQAGASFYNGPVSDTLLNCNGCHRLNVTGNAEFDVAKPGFFGGDGQSSFENETQHLKIPHLRNMYQKVGMFGMIAVPFFLSGDNNFKGDQVRGFGFLHDGSVDTIFRFHNATVFNPNFPFLNANPTGIPDGPAGEPLRRQLEAFMMAFDSNLAPIVGQQTTRTSTNGGVADPRITLLVQRANAGECDLIAKGRRGGEDRGALYVGGGMFVTDRAADAPLSDAVVRAFANTPGQEVTFTCVPPGSGTRIGVDRDGDLYGDSDEIDAGSDPADPLDTPPNGITLCTSLTPVTYTRAKLKDGKGQLSIIAKDLPLGTYAQDTVAAVAADGGGTIVALSQSGATIVPKGSGFKFTAPRGTIGITRVTVKEKNNAPGLFKVTLQTKTAWTAPAADETIATTVVTLNIGGQCFEGNATKVSP